MNSAAFDRITQFQAMSGLGMGSGAPQWRQLPKPPERCPDTGLSRSHIYSLILPTKENGYRPPVKSVSLKGKNATRGVRLYSVPSLLAWIEAQATKSHTDA